MNKIAVKTKNKNICQIYRPALVMLLTLGYDFDFLYSNPIAKIAQKVYCLILVIIVIYATIFCCPIVDISRLWSMLEYSTTVTAMLFFKSNILKFFQRLEVIDTYLRIKINHYNREKYKIFVSISIIWLIRIIYTVSYCLYVNSECFDDITLYLIGQVSLLALDLKRVWRFILYDTVRYRLKILRTRLQETEFNYYLYVNNNRTIKESKFKFCLYLYKSLADITDLITPEIHASLFLSVSCNLPKLIISVYNIILVIEQRVPMDTLCFVLVYVLQVCILLFTPFVVIECYSVEVERIRLFLMNKLMDETDHHTKEEMDMFLRYTEIRPFKYKIWRIIPINMSLPLELVNICITYVIVIINFTHLYD